MDAHELTVEEARVVLEEHVRKTAWLRRDLSKTLPIDSFERSGSFHLSLRSFTEKRETSPAYTPHWGGEVDGPENGRPPAMWDIPVQIPGRYINQDHSEPVPHTAEVRTCFECGGRGKVTCHGCSGSGRVRCSNCSGDGRVNRTRTKTRTNAQGQVETETEHYTETCSRCGGDGKVTCSDCGGDGVVTCGPCNGAGRLKHYQRLTVTWNTWPGNEVIEKTDLPDELIQDAEGIVVWSEEEVRLEQKMAGGGGAYRGTGRLNVEVNEAANRLIASHVFGREFKLHCQALIVRAVPVYEARYRWGKEQRRFWVFGTDRLVYAPKYPLSVHRLVAAIGLPTAAAAGVFGFLASQPGPPVSPPMPVTPVYTAPDLPSPPPIPEIPTPPPEPPAAETAKGPKPVAPKGKYVLEVRTFPAGATVTLGGKKMGQAPLFLTLPAALPGLCTNGKCKVGRCVDGKRCESVSQLRITARDGQVFGTDVTASDGDVFVHRFDK
ncbi:MAG: PEGA domain-containing protein [Polyangiaceae bacterium]|nr:PEGA domain-containing protein [Polyangiaceae bacterium]